MSLLQMSIQGGILIFVIAVIRAGTKERLPKSTFPILWMIALARLLIPLTIPSGFSAYTAVERRIQNNITPIVSSSPALNRVPAVNQPMFSLWTIIWASGAIIFAMYFVLGYIHFWQKYRFSVPVKDAFAVKWMQEHPLRRSVSLRQSDQVSEPLTYGILHPVILLPKDVGNTGNDQLSYILAHEMTHIRHFDTLWKFLSTAALCLHWLNPFVWMLCVLLGRDLELFCDACVVWQFGEPSRPAYAMTLIQMEEQRSGLQPFGSYFSKTDIEERITAIMKIKKASAKMILAAVSLVAILSIVFATSAAASTVMLPENVKMLKQFQFPGWKQMTVSEFQNRANLLFDEPQMNEWQKAMENNTQYMQAKDDDPMCSFLYNVLFEVTAERWQLREDGGAAVSDYPKISDNAVLEYIFQREVLNRDRLTVGEFCAAREGVWAEMQTILDGLPREMLADQTAMNEWLPKRIAEIFEKWSSDNLRIVLKEYIYMPLSTFSEQGSEIPSESLEGKRSEVNLDEYTETAPDDAYTEVVPNDEEPRQYPSATREDYDSLLQLKTEDYQSMTLETFNQRLLNWADESYERMERVGESVNRGEVERERFDWMTAADKSFLTLTTNLSGIENAMKVRSSYTGRPEEDPSLSFGYSKQIAEDGKAAFCELYCQFSYHISDSAKETVTVGERDRCIDGFLRAVRSFWNGTSLEELLKLDKSSITAIIQQLAAQNNTQNIEILIERNNVFYEWMDERNID